MTNSAPQLPRGHLWFGDSRQGDCKGGRWLSGILWPVGSAALAKIGVVV